MKTLVQPLIVLLLFVFVRGADLAFTAAVAREYLRAVCYGLVALFALIALILALVV